MVLTDLSRDDQRRETDRILCVGVRDDAVAMAAEWACRSITVMKTKFNSNNDRQLFIIGGTAMDAALELSNIRCHRPRWHASNHASK